MTQTASTDKTGSAKTKRTEPRLEDLPEDTAMQLHVARDGVNRGDLTEPIAVVRRKLIATRKLGNTPLKSS